MSTAGPTGDIERVQCTAAGRREGFDASQTEVVRARLQRGVGDGEIGIALHHHAIIAGQSIERRNTAHREVGEGRFVVAAGTGDGRILDRGESDRRQRVDFQRGIAQNQGVEIAGVHQRIARRVPFERGCFGPTTRIERGGRSAGLFQRGRLDIREGDDHLITRGELRVGQREVRQRGRFDQRIVAASPIELAAKIRASSIRTALRPTRHIERFIGGRARQKRALNIVQRERLIDRAIDQQLGIAQRVVRRATDNHVVQRRQRARIVRAAAIDRQDLVGRRVVQTESILAAPSFGMFNVAEGDATKDRLGELAVLGAPPMVQVKSFGALIKSRRSTSLPRLRLKPRSGNKSPAAEARLLTSRWTISFPTPVLRISVLFESNTDCTGNVAVRLSALTEAPGTLFTEMRVSGSVEASISKKFAPLRRHVSSLADWPHLE